MSKNIKKIRVGCAVVLFSIFALAGNVFADFVEIFMTDANESTTSKTIFDWNETPWLRLKLPQSALNVTGAWWQDPDDTYFFTASDPDTNQNVWLTLDNWNEVKKLGLWNVRAGYLYANGTAGTGSTSFTVTPEPVSSILFLVGSASLVAFRYRKRKKPLVG